MALVVRIVSDVSNLTKGFDQAIVSANNFAAAMKNVETGAGTLAALRGDLISIQSAFGKSERSFADFTKGSVGAAQNLSKAIDKLPKRLDALSDALEKAVKQLDRLGASSAHIAELARRIDLLGATAKSSMADLAAMGSEIRMAVGAMSAATRGAQQTHSALTQMARSIDESSSLWTKFGVALGGALVGNLVANMLSRLQDAVMRLPGQMIQLAGSLQQTEVALNTMVGAGNKAAGFLADMQAFAAQTPFEFDGLMRSSKMLLAMGINAQAILPIMRRVGDAMAAVGGSSYAVENVTRALSQMAAKGKVNAEELNQLAENGIRILPILAKITNKSTADVLQMAEKGQLLASKYLPQIINAIGDSFTGQMEKQNKTITGSLAALNDAFKLTFAEIGKALNDVTGFTDKVRSLATALTDVGKAVKQSGLMGIFDAIFGINAQNAINGFNMALIAIGVTAAASALKFLATAEALAKFRAVMLATTLATLRQTVIFAAIGAAAFTVGANFNWLSERLAPFGKAWNALFYMAGQQIYNFSQVTLGVMKAVRYAITGNFKEAEKSINSANDALNSVTKDFDGMIRDVSGIGFSFKEGFVNPVTEIQKVWINLTDLFTEKTGKMTLGSEKLTASMMGLKKETEAVKTKDISGKLAREANQSANVANALTAYGLALKDIAAKEAELGYFYDENKAKAAALTPVIAAMSARYGAASVKVQELRNEQQGYIKASTNVSQVEERHAKTLASILDAGLRLQTNLKTIANDLEDQGDSFNAAEKKARALKQAYRELSNIKIGDKAGFAEFIKNFDASKMPGFGDDMMRGIADSLASGDTTAISEALKSAISKASQEAQAFDVSEILRGAETELSVMAMVAKATGKEFNEAAAQAEVFGRTIEALARKGTPEATAAMAKLSKQIIALKPQKVADEFGLMFDAISSVGNAANAMYRIFEDLGITIPDSIKSATSAVGNFVSAIGAVTSATNALTVAMAANPILLTLGVAIGAIIWSFTEMTKHIEEQTEATRKQTEEINRQIAAWNEAADQQAEYQQNIQRNRASLSDAIEEAVSKQEKYGEVAKELTYQEMVNVAALAIRFEDAQERMINAAWGSVEERKAAEESYARIYDELMAKLPAAMQYAMATGNTLFLDGIANLRKDARTRFMELSADISNTIKSGIVGAMKSAGIEFINGSKDWTTTLRKGIKDAIVGAMVEAFVTKGLLAPMMKQIEELGQQAAASLDIAAGGSGTIDSSIMKKLKGIIGQTDAVAGQIEGLFGGIKGAFEGYKTTTEEAKQTELEKAIKKVDEINKQMNVFTNTEEMLKKKSDAIRDVLNQMLEDNVSIGSEQFKAYKEQYDLIMKSIDEMNDKERMRRELGSMGDKYWKELEQAAKNRDDALFSSNAERIRQTQEEYDRWRSIADIMPARGSVASPDNTGFSLGDIRPGGAGNAYEITINAYIKGEGVMSREQVNQMGQAFVTELNRSGVKAYR